MPNIGFQELVIFLIIVLVLFGANKLPRLGRGLGEGIRNFRHGLKGDVDESEASESPRATE